MLALLLDLAPDDLGRIKSTAHGASEPQMSIIRKWLQSGEASWAALVTALKDDFVGHGSTANDITKKYPKS